MYQYDENYLYHCHAEASKMYPESYNKIYPYVKRKCEEMDNEYDQRMNPFPTKETIDQMTDEIYEEYKKDYGVEDAPTQGSNLTRYNGYIGRDLITILLLGSLLGRRRRRFRRRRFYGGYGYPFGGGFY
ncbi:hypothetical protein [Wukongibacter sp. M2B1]|uniref:hypothetical protein n=1 Tax=Wukongibacter sp. M2B1 TaxID=3088895 RepID=UPI003D7BA04A